MLNLADKEGERMATETIEEFLARGGKISKSTDNDLSLEELLTKEGLMNDNNAKTVESLLTSSISDSLNKELKPKED